MLVELWVQNRHGKEPEPNKNELNQNPGSAKNWTEPESKNVQEPKSNPVP